MREVRKLEKGWKFCLTELGTEVMPDLEYVGWQDVLVPHDWAIYGEFSPQNDPQPLESSVLDFHENMIQIGRTGGLPIKGTGWYVLELFLPDTYCDYALEFDGIMNHGEVYINGEKAGYRPYGYSSFTVNMVPYMKKNEVNRVVVKVNSLDKTSRWYPGAGIFRPVRLVMNSESYVAYNGIWLRPEYCPESQTAELMIQCDLKGNGIAEHTIFLANGIAIAACSGIKTRAILESVQVWDVDSPVLYTLMTEVLFDNRVVDRVFTRFGVRKAVFDRETGFTLNGKPMKLNGVCLHHDSGMLGAAYNKDAVYRKLSTLKEMGCNALRTTHNPPCPETLDLCDQLGIMVLEEVFDVWHTPKALNDYANEFAEWAETDLTDMIRRDRNHPCIILYSIGNEIPDQMQPEGRNTCRWLTSICHREDDSRPVTCGFNRPKEAIENGLTEEVDIVGLNYSPTEYHNYHKMYPHWTLVATETCSSVSSRGEYYLPAKMEIPPVKHDNLQVNSYDYSAVACAYIADVEFDAQNEAPFIAGQFVWTGYDYLGEPTPYREEWPSRSSYFGILDLAGLKKDRYYAYAANWSEKPVLHLFPHWNWEPGQLVDVHCYTNLERISLYLNGREIRKQSRKNHRIVFEKIPFEPGRLRAVGYCTIDGKEQEICEDIIHTSGAPYAIMLNCDKREVLANGKALAFIEVSIVDEKGVLCPDANNCIYFSVEGEGAYVASDAGDATSTRVFSKPYCEAFHGKLVCAVQAKEQPGNILVHINAEGLKGNSLVIRVEEG